MTTPGSGKSDVEIQRERYLDCLSKGFSEDISVIFAVTKGEAGNFLNLDKMFNDYQAAIKQGLPEIPAIIFATSSGDFRDVDGGLENVLRRYHLLIQVGRTEEEAIRESIF